MKFVDDDDDDDDEFVIRLSAECKSSKMESAAAA